MSLGERLNALGRLQRSRRFKVVASAVVLVLAAAAAVTVLYFAQDADPELRSAVEDAAAARVELREASEAAENRLTEEVRGLLDEYQRLEARVGALRLERLESGDSAVTPQTLDWLLPAIGVGAAGAIAAVWIGLSLTYLGVAFLALVVAAPLILLGPGTRGVGLLVAGMAPLVVLLLTLLEVARLALSPSYPLTAIAKNVLNEAVRMRISLVFIVVLLLLLAVIPLVLDEDQPLNYRVSQWVQYGGGLGFAVLALLTVFFSSASVAFEQRDKLIWQTVSKPVAAWQYIAGKWVGVMTLNLVLLSMTAGAIFIFTEYLRNQPARGEIAAFITERGYDTRVLPSLMTDDRRILENEVLVARRSVEPTMPTFAEAMDSEAFQEVLRSRVEARQANQSGLEITEAVREEIAREVYDEAWLTVLRAVPVGAGRRFVFEGLEEVAEGGGDERLTMRYRIQAGSNDPSAIYRLGFRINGTPWPQPSNDPNATAIAEPGVQQVALDAMQRMSVPARLVNDEGVLNVDISNIPPNRWTLVFEPGDLEILYPVGGYELNFAKAVAVMWVKLGFIAAIAIAASTFLSFPVAVLMAIVALFAAESAGFLSSSLGQFRALTDDEEIRPVRVVVRLIAMPIAWFFESYASTKPVERLTTGRVLTWGDFGSAVSWILVWTGVVLAAGVAIFRKRELATYSGS